MRDKPQVKLSLSQYFILLFTVWFSGMAMGMALYKLIVK